MKTRKQSAFFGIAAVIAFCFAFAACDDGSGKEQEQEHSGTISAFDRTITIKGDASISDNDFTNVTTKLEEAMVALDNATKEQADSQARYTHMLDRTGFAIIIETGNASPNANANKQMTVGVNYLLTNDAEPTIALGIRAKVITENAFAE